MKTQPTVSWYARLKKPSRAPPAWLFGPARSVLYILIFISFGNVFFLAWRNEIAFIIALPFLLNLIFNLAFSWLQFKLQNNILATIDILLILLTILFSMIAIYPYAHRIMYMQIPYLLWVGFATVLQITITKLNRKK
ncbi:MAG: TspO/MBR family protein [bacterium]